jgi:hypothetical protein
MSDNLAKKLDFSNEIAKNKRIMQLPTYRPYKAI